MFRWQKNIETAVLECAKMGKVPNTPVPVDPNIETSRPKPTMTKVRWLG